MSAKYKGATRELVLKANEAIIRASTGSIVVKKSVPAVRRPRLTGSEINNAYAAAVKQLNAA